MIRQAAFTAATPLLKGGLHCHTTRSDGHGTPEAVIRMHAQNGYDFLALTDHRIYNYKNFAPDTGVLIVPGMEMDRNLPAPGGVHCFHTVCIGPAREDGNGFEQDQTFPSGRVTDQAEFQPLLDSLHANGNLTIYCHPEWSFTPACEFDRLRGNFAMEIYNNGCAMENDMDTNAACWDALLRAGQRIFGVATDDGHAMDQHCGGWVRVNAQKTLPDILRALRDGAFYSSCGPEITDFYVEDGHAVLACSPCKSISFDADFAPTSVTRDAQGCITSARFPLRPHHTYVRATVMDAQGRRAWTNPIFLTQPV